MLNTLHTAGGTTYDITLGGSLVSEAFSIEDAKRRALGLSFEDFPGRLIRVHGADGIEVIFEARDGRPEFDADEN